jgi:hypothetical protein
MSRRSREQTDPDSSSHTSKPRIQEVEMTFDPERRSDLDPNDPIRQRMVDGEGVGWVPAVLFGLLVVGFLYVAFGGSMTTEPGKGPVDNSARIEQPVAPAPAPAAPKPAAPN